MTLHHRGRLTVIAMVLLPVIALAIACLEAIMPCITGLALP
jgi:hypothetical protein